MTRATAMRGRSGNAATAMARAVGELRAVVVMTRVTRWSGGSRRIRAVAVAVAGRAVKKIAKGGSRAMRSGAWVTTVRACPANMANTAAYSRGRTRRLAGVVRKRCL